MLSPYNPCDTIDRRWLCGRLPADQPPAAVNWCTSPSPLPLTHHRLAPGDPYKKRPWRLKYPRLRLGRSHPAASPSVISYPQRHALSFYLLFCSLFLFLFPAFPSFSFVSSGFILFFTFSHFNLCLIFHWRFFLFSFSFYFSWYFTTCHSFYPCHLLWPLSSGIWADKDTVCNHRLSAGCTQVGHATTFLMRCSILYGTGDFYISDI